MKDGEFAQKVFSAESAAVVQQLFEEKDVDLSISEIESIGSALSQPAEGELDENDLEMVAGGTSGIEVSDFAKRLAEQIKISGPYTTTPMPWAPSPFIFSPTDNRPLITEGENAGKRW